MLFDDKAVCAPLYIRELTAQDGTVQPGEAPLCLVLASSGRAAVSVQGATFGLVAGSLLLWHGTANITPATNCHLLAVGLTGTAAQQVGQSLPTPLLTDCSLCPLAAQAIDALAQAMRRREDAALPCLAYTVLCAIAHADEQAAPSTLPPLVAEAVLAIRQNYAGLYGVEELSAQLGVSKSHLVRTFSAAMGVGPGQYLIAVRVDAAKALLVHRDYALEVIASLCGFSGANYLCKVFKKHTGLTPDQWRKTYAGHSVPAVDVSALEKALYM